MKLIKVLCATLLLFFIDTEGMSNGNITFGNTSTAKNPLFLYNQTPASNIVTAPFKLGIELQEGHRLCSWAKTNFSIQKKPIFSVYHDRQKLWNLEIDGSDIEFITEPFSSEQRHLLKLGMESVESAVGLLEENTTDISFKDFRDELDIRLKKIGNFDVELLPLASTLQKIEKPKQSWNASFMPQATVQFPLEWSIPLSAVLLKDTAQEAKFNAAFPFRDDLKSASTDRTSLDEIKRLCLKNKGLGLMFSHSLTMSSMTRGLPRVHDDDATANAIKKIFIDFHEHGQFDAKKKVPLMSRRPFSQMYMDPGVKESIPDIVMVLNRLIQSNHQHGHQQKILSLNSTYRDVVNTAFLVRNRYFHSIKEGIHKANYAEQYYEYSDKGQKVPVNFNSSKEALFKDSFLGLANKNIYSKHKSDFEYHIEDLLTNGILSTTMLENSKHIPQEVLDECFSKRYYMNILGSVSNPELFKRYCVAEQDKVSGFKTSTCQKPIKFEERDYKYDWMSPLHFLDLETDAMGHYKNVADVDKYGEALIEIRGISRIGSDLLSKMSISNKMVGKFLKLPHEVKSHAVAFFDFLSGFEKDITDAASNLHGYTITAIEDILAKFR